MNTCYHRWVQTHGLNILVHPAVYPPSEDTFLLLEAVEQELNKGDYNSGLEVGSGSGLIAVYMAKRLDRVVAVDKNPYAVKCTLLNAYINGVRRRLKVLESDLFEKIGSEKFDLIVFNPPYLPPEEGVMDEVQGGIPLIERFLKEAGFHLTRKGRILFVSSSLTPVEDVFSLLEQNNYRYEIVSKREFFMEEIFVIKAF